MSQFIKLIYPVDYHARFGVRRSRQEKVVEKSLYSNDQLRLFMSRGVAIEPVEETKNPTTKKGTTRSRVTTPKRASKARKEKRS